MEDLTHNAVASYPKANPHRDYAFWDRHPGIAWSNPHADDQGMMMSAVYQLRVAALDDIALHFGPQAIAKTWQYMQAHAELAEDVERIRRITPHMESWFEKVSIPVA